MYTESSLFGLFLINMTNTITGDIFITLLTILMVVLLFFLALRIPLELSAVLIVPLLIVYIIEFGSDQWIAISGILVLYLGIMFSKYFFK